MQQKLVLEKVAALSVSDRGFSFEYAVMVDHTRVQTVKQSLYCVIVEMRDFCSSKAASGLNSSWTARRQQKSGNDVMGQAT